MHAAKSGVCIGPGGECWSKWRGECWVDAVVVVVVVVVAAVVGGGGCCCSSSSCRCC